MEDIVVVKKRGRPAKGANANAAPAAGSPIETIPKKRGRPSKSKGRGRPPKVAAAASDNEDSELIEEEAANGDEMEPIKSKGRGRPRKEPIVMHGSSDNDDDDADSVKQSKPAKKQPKSSSAKRRKLGRPRKHQPSDEDEDDDDEEVERRPVGRPPAGTEHAGRGAGRPKKVAAAGANGDEPPKKRGRPALSNKAPYVPSGKPRGRPKSNKAAANEAEEPEDESDNEVDELEETTAVMSTPKKRGRPAGLEKPQSTGKSRGRPKAAKSYNYQLDDEADEPDSAAELDEEPNLNAAKPAGKRGRPPKESGNKDANGDDDDDYDDSSAAENHSEEAVKQSPRKLPKPEAKKDKSTEDAYAGTGNAGDSVDAGHDNGESVECISDEVADA